MASKAVTVITNSFVISKLPTKTYYQYDLFGQLEDKLPNAAKRQRLIDALQTIAYPAIFQPRAVYDGGRLLYSTKSIPDGTYRVHGSNQSSPPNAAGWYEIKISRTAGKDIRPTAVNRLMQGQINDETSTAANLLQLLLCQAANLRNPNTGRAYFNDEDTQQIRGMAVDLWRGYFQAVRPTVGRMLVTVDVTVCAMYRPGPLVDVALAVLNIRDVRDLAIRDKGHPNFMKLLKHLKKCLITVKTDPKRTKTIRDLIPGPVGRFEFVGNNGTTTNIQAHYRAAHSISLKFPDTIGVVTSGKNAPFPVVIPLELCSLIPGQLYKKHLPPDATATVVSFSAMSPNDRLRVICEGKLNKPAASSPIQEYANSEFMMEAGMLVDPKTISVKGHMLQVPSLVYGGNNQVKPRDGSWNVVGNQFCNPKEMSKWGVINFDSRSISQQDRNKIINELMSCCKNLGMSVANPGSVHDGNGFDVYGAIQRTCNELGGAQGVQMILILLPANAPDIRTRVKHFGDTQIGVRTQCLRQSKLLRANNQYYNNVALKLNARLGGANALVASPVLSEVAKGPFMILGLDTSHPPQGTGFRPSVASLVWSHDTHGAEYCAMTCLQGQREELIADLTEMVGTAIDMFGAKYRVPPARMFFYRDGVSDGEFSQVRDVEIEAINNAIDKVWTHRKLSVEKPKITFIVVGKRHHVTFFPSSKGEGDRTGNCRAGLVVDDKDLTNPQFPNADFYLQSHSAIKGTSRSGHYTVLKDDNFKGNIAKLQELSFALCHIYAKATRSVSIPAPVYYADLACARGKFHMPPDSKYDFDAGSSTSGGEGSLVLDTWKKEFAGISRNIRESMFFL